MRTTASLPAILLLLLAGCASPDSGLEPEGEPGAGELSWWFSKGVQCVTPAWEDWAAETGHDHNATPGGEPYENDNATADLIEAFYADRGRNVTAVAYRDGSVYATGCGNPNPWNYWTWSRGAPGQEHIWDERPEGPPAEALG